MKISYKDILNFFNKKPSIELLSEKLFQLGHEHEIIGEIFDMELTPNRGDCLSLSGLSRDLNIFFGLSKHINIYQNEIDDLIIDFENKSPDDCTKITFMEIEIDKPSDNYEDYLLDFFNQLGHKKTNFFTDISNYVSYELGQPTHCYDRESINSKIIFDKRFDKHEFKSLLGENIKLKNKNCIFMMDEKVINLAGIVGSESTACSKNTKKVLIECAHFNPESIIGESLRYNINSDAAHKFERGTDPNCHEYVLKRFAKIVDDHAEIKSIKLKSFHGKEFIEASIPFDINKIKKILGIELKKDDYMNVLTNLGFDVTDNSIRVPSYRNDIKTQNDLAEEVARVLGYNNIESKIFSLKNFKKDERINKEAYIEKFLTQNAFYEVINFPFSSEKDSHSISIDNPLDSKKNFLRRSLKESLIFNLLYNERRQKDCLKLFEISNIYSKEISINEEKKLGIIISGRVGDNYRDFSKKLNFKYLDNLLNSKFDSPIFKIEEIPRENLNTKRKDKIFYTELLISDIPDSFYLNLAELAEEDQIIFNKYRKVSEYPSSVRDFSFLISDISMVDVVIKELEKISDNIIKKSFIFDFYFNDISNSLKLGYRIIFQSPYKTLSDKEINDKVSEILDPILKIDSVSIPGM